MGKTPERRLLERPRFRWKDSTEMDVKATEWVSVNWFNQAEDGTGGGSLSSL